jgi:uncharacterized membrane protein
MTSDFPQDVGKIVADYLERLSSRLKGMPAMDRQELLNEVRSHIYEAYADQTGGDEIERILQVLRRLGDPADVVSSRMPQAVARLGRGKKAPFYILAGTLIALFGVPLGLGAVAALVGLLAGLFALLIGYYGAAVSLVVGGFAAAVVCAIALWAPGVIDAVNQMFGAELVSFGPFQYNPELGGFLGLMVSLLVIAVGLLMLWSGKHLWRGFRFTVVLIAQNVRAIFSRLTAS